MAQASRRTITLAVLAIAAWLHLTLCAWQSAPLPPGGGVPSRLITEDRIVGLGTRFNTVRHNTPCYGYAGWGLFARTGVSAAEGAVWGVAVPVGALAALLVLWFQWRRSDRVARGACVNCGQRLDPASGGRCPECGLQQRVPA